MPQPMIPEPTGSPGPSPSDHLRLLIELLRPTGPELARRWLSALMLVPEAERASVVAAVEGQIVREYAGSNADARGTGHGETGAQRPGVTRSFTSVSPPRQRDGYVETLETTYEVSEDVDGAGGANRSPSRGADGAARRRRSGGT
ncbi:MAG: hypothetical protein R3B68_04160 [Phycisphaerales bacterium]